jgi:hypothetical protein
MLLRLDLVGLRDFGAASSAKMEIMVRTIEFWSAICRGRSHFRDGGTAKTDSTPTERFKSFAKNIAKEKK